MVLKRTLNHKRTWIKSAPLLSVVSTACASDRKKWRDIGIDRQRHSADRCRDTALPSLATLSSPRYFAGKRPSMEQSVAPHEKLARYMPKHANSRGGQRHSKKIVRITVLGDRITLLT